MESRSRETRRKQVAHLRAVAVIQARDTGVIDVTS